MGDTSECYDKEHDMGHVIWHDMTLWQHCWVVTSQQTLILMLWDRISGDNIDIIASLEDIDIIEEEEDISVCLWSHWAHIPPMAWCWVIIAIIMDPT